MEVISIWFGPGQGPFPVIQIRSCLMPQGTCHSVRNVFLQGNGAEIFFLRSLLNPLQLTLPVHSVLIPTLPTLRRARELCRPGHSPRAPWSGSLTSAQSLCMSSPSFDHRASRCFLPRPHRGSMCHPKAGLSAALRGSTGMPCHEPATPSSCVPSILVGPGGIERAALAKLWIGLVMTKTHGNAPTFPLSLNLDCSRPL